MALPPKQYYITALEMRDVFVTPDDEEFYTLMRTYEKLKKNYNPRNKKWLAAAKELNADFEKFVKKLFARPPFELSRVPCGIEVYTVQQILEESVGWKHLSLVGLEFTQVPFQEMSEYVEGGY